MNNEKTLDQMKEIKRDLGAIGRMTVGSITKQFNVCGTPGCKCKDKTNPQKHGPYFYLRSSYGKKTRLSLSAKNLCQRSKSRLPSTGNLRRWSICGLSSQSSSLMPSFKPCENRELRNELDILA